KYSRDSCGAAGDPVSVYGRAWRKACTAYLRIEPSPVTGKTRGACPGCVMDHVIPLCAGGADDPLNLQWQTIADAKAKDREEAEGCRQNRGNGVPARSPYKIRLCPTVVLIICEHHVIAVP